MSKEIFEMQIKKYNEKFKKIQSLESSILNQKTKLKSLSIEKSTGVIASLEQMSFFYLTVLVMFFSGLFMFFNSTELKNGGLYAVSSEYGLQVGISVVLLLGSALFYFAMKWDEKIYYVKKATIKENIIKPIFMFFKSIKNGDILDKNKREKWKTEFEIARMKVQLKSHRKDLKFMKKYYLKDMDFRHYLSKIYQGFGSHKRFLFKEFVLV